MTRIRFFIDPTKTDQEILDALNRMKAKRVRKHYGPGAHPGTGTDQTVHDPGTGGGGGEADGGDGSETDGATTDTVYDASRPPSPREMAAPNPTETSLRPTTLDGFVGQDRLKENLRIMADSARTRGQPLDHVLFGGPPGLGKTTLANIMANEMGSNLHVVTGPVLRTPNDLMAKLSVLQDGDILFIDEIHALPTNVQEILYPAMEDFEMDFKLNGDGPPVRLELPKFTLIGATTRAGDLAQPLRDRFGMTAELDFYEPTRLAEIVTSTSGKLGLDMDPQAALLIAERSRGTPRLANNHTEWIRDFSLAREGGATITTSTVDSAFRQIGVDHAGLSKDHRDYLRALTTSGTSGLKNIAAVMGEEEVNIADAIEPYLIRDGFVTRSPRGRLITDKGIAHLQSLADSDWVEKADSDTFATTVSIAKVDDQHRVFGWASVALSADGTQIIDKQGDMIDIEDLEEAAYNFVLKSYGTGDMHRSESFGKLIESVIYTPEKMEAMGIPSGTLPSAWWVGFGDLPPEYHAMVKSGKRKMFSIEGTAKRHPIPD